jgi:xanthine phosphoribosyltransferase
MPTQPVKLKITWDQFHADTKLLGNRLYGLDIKGIVAITRGGLVPACLLAHRLNVNMIDCLGAGSYVQDQRKKVALYKIPHSHFKSMKGVIVVDELSETGNTLREARRLLPDALLCTVYNKQKDPGGGPVEVWGRLADPKVWLQFPWEND